jgi:hypothetical protein
MAVSIGACDPAVETAGVVRPDALTREVESVRPPTPLTLHPLVVRMTLTGTSRTEELDPMLVDVWTSVRASSWADVDVSDSTSKLATEAETENLSAARAGPVAPCDGALNILAKRGVARSVTATGTSSRGENSSNPVTNRPATTSAAATSPDDPGVGIALPTKAPVAPTARTVVAFATLPHIACNDDNSSDAPCLVLVNR